MCGACACHRLQFFAFVWLIYTLGLALYAVRRLMKTNIHRTEEMSVMAGFIYLAGADSGSSHMSLRFRHEFRPAYRSADGGALSLFRFPHSDL
ncbi:YndJ family transporter [Bacillus velezensis]|nr:YndJ family transporter [Bacillus velezensis]